MERTYFSNVQLLQVKNYTLDCDECEYRIVNVCAKGKFIRFLVEPAKRRQCPAKWRTALDRCSLNLINLCKVGAKPRPTPKRSLLQ